MFAFGEVLGNLKRQPTQSSPSHLMLTGTTLNHYFFMMIYGVSHALPMRRNMDIIGWPYMYMMLGIISTNIH